MQYEELIQRPRLQGIGLLLYLHVMDHTSGSGSYYVIATKFSCLSSHTPLIFQPHLPHTTLNSLQPLRGLSHSRIIQLLALLSNKHGRSKNSDLWLVQHQILYGKVQKHFKALTPYIYKNSIQIW